MKRINRFISIMLAAILLFIFAAGCADNTQVKSGDTDFVADIDPEETDMKSLRSKISDDLPDTKYNGATFTMMVRKGLEKQYFMEEQSGDVVDDAVYSRNLAVEQRFDIKFKIFPVAGGWNEQATFLSSIRQSVLADDDAFDCIEGYAAYVATFASEKLFGNWLELPYIDAEKPWWSQGSAEEFTINGRLFFLTGDLAISLWSYLYVILFNKTLVEDYRFPNMYDLVRSGEWTLDKLKELVSGVYLDLDGNSRLNDKDLYGFAISRGCYMDALHIMFNQPVTVKNADGIPELNIMSEGMETFAANIIDLLYNNTGVYSVPETETVTKELQDMFVQNQIVLSPQYLHSVEALRDKDTDFGIIPYPKYDSNQKTYLSTSQDGYSIFCYPITVNDLSMCSVIIEALAAESYKQVIPAYYEIALKTKFSRDEESAEMLDLIRESMAYNFGAINSANIGAPVQLIRTVVASSKGSYARSAKSIEKLVTNKLAKLLEAYLD